LAFGIEPGESWMSQRSRLDAEGLRTYVGAFFAMKK
jgi:hypothetical protein